MNTSVLRKDKTKRVVLTIQANKYPFFMKLVENFDFVEIMKEETGDSKQEIVANLAQGFKELKLYKQGKLKTTTTQDFLNEL
jgi:hypothetical protein